LRFNAGSTESRRHFFLVLPEASGTNRNGNRDHHEHEGEDEWHAITSA
jgi:hypothetical protein